MNRKKTKKLDGIQQGNGVDFNAALAALQSGQSFTGRDGVLRPFPQVP